MTTSTDTRIAPVFPDTKTWKLAMAAFGKLAGRKSPRHNFVPVQVTVTSGVLHLRINTATAELLVKVPAVGNTPFHTATFNYYDMRSWSPEAITQENLSKRYTDLKKEERLYYLSGQGFTVAPYDLYSALHAVDYAAGVSDTRPAIKCVYLTTENNRTRLVTTDGQRLAAVYMDRRDHIEHKSLTIPTATAAALKIMAKGVDNEIEFDTDGEEFRFSGDVFNLTGATTGMEYVNYNYLAQIPRNVENDPALVARAGTAKWITAQMKDHRNLRKVMKDPLTVNELYGEGSVAMMKDLHLVVVDFEEHTLSMKLAAHVCEKGGKWKDRLIRVETSGELVRARHDAVPADVGINIHYLKDTLTRMKGRTVMLYNEHPYSPVVLSENEDLHVIMPMRF